MAVSRSDQRRGSPLRGANARRGARPLHRSPRGDEFEVIGRAGPVQLERAPYIPAEAREELLVIKEGNIFLCARPDGDIHHARVTGEGLYAHDTRYLSELSLRLDGTAPVALSYTSESGYRAVVDATNSTLQPDGEPGVPQQTLSLQRVLVISGRLYHLARLRSYAKKPITTTLDVSLGADFADVFEVRGGPRRATRGHALAPKRTAHGLSLAYVGEDEGFRETLIEFDPEPAAVRLDTQGATASWVVTLEPGETEEVLVTVEPSFAGRRRPRRRIETAAARLDQAQRDWEASCTRVETDNEIFNRLVSASLRDLHALITPAPGGEILAAGIPWYVAPFGRDSLLTALATMMLRPELARETLRVLAGLQSRKDDPWRDAEPGKIPHELRFGELARAGIVPHTPYYGTVDATPLFLVLAAAYYRWTSDLEFMADLRPALDAALQWLAEYGDRDGDGFIEYERRSPAGLRNQGWKDSDDCVAHADGALAEGPIALVEVQGYVYLGKLSIADVYDALGAGDVAKALRAEAASLRRSFNDAFWDAEEGTFVLALDGRKRQVRSVTSNPAHSLFCGIADDARASAVVERLMAPDMFSGWGIRTLSSSSLVYNPMSYHNGSVWPHDNAIAAAAFKRCGFQAESERVATALFEVASTARDFRLPELYCGFDRHDSASVVAYPVACIPQAWATAVPYFLLEAMLGISGRAPENRLTIERPALPGWLGHVELHGLRVGASSVGLAFERAGEVTGFSVLELQGSLDVTIP